MLLHSAQLHFVPLLDFLFRMQLKWNSCTIVINDTNLSESHIFKM